MPERAEEALTNAEALRGVVALVSSVLGSDHQSLTMQAERVAAAGAVAMAVEGRDLSDVALLLSGEGAIPAVAVSQRDFYKLQRAKVVVLEVGDAPEPEPEPEPEQHVRMNGGV
jgi:hypothetical protein